MVPAAGVMVTARPAAEIGMDNPEGDAAIGFCSCTNEVVSDALRETVNEITASTPSGIVLLLTPTTKHSYAAEVRAQLTDFPAAIAVGPAVT